MFLFNFKAILKLILSLFFILFILYNFIFSGIVLADEGLSVMELDG
jgi:hypothetical protein